MSASWLFPFPVWLVPAAVIGLLLSLRQLSRWLQPKVYLTAVESLLTPAELRFYRTLLAPPGRPLDLNGSPANGAQPG